MSRPDMTVDEEAAMMRDHYSQLYGVASQFTERMRQTAIRSHPSGRSDAEP